MADGGILSGVSSLAGGVVDAIFGNRENKRNREWQERMWHMNNEYNTPTMQMQRYKAAGLNPHLIYGQGNSGNASMATLPQQTPTKIGSSFADAAMNYVATRKQQTEIDNMVKAREVMDADKQLKNAQTANQLSSSAKTDQEVQQAGDLFDTTMAQAQANLRNTDIVSDKLKAEIANTLQNTKASEQNVRESQQRIEEIVQRIINMKTENNLKGVEIELKTLN